MLNTLEDFVNVTKDRVDYEAVDAWEEIIPLTRDVVRRQIQRLQAQDVDMDDIVSEILVALLMVVAKKSNSELKAPIRAWIATVARNRLISALRRKSVARKDCEERSLVGDNWVGGDASFNDIHQEDIELLDDELAKLTEFDRTLIICRSIQDLPWKEVAEILKSTGKSEGTLRRDHSRVMKKLKERLRRQC